MGGIGSGGFREGSGRKLVDGTPRVRISVTLPAWLADLVQAESVRQERPLSHLITELLTKGIER